MTSWMRRLFRSTKTRQRTTAKPSTRTRWNGILETRLAPASTCGGRRHHRRRQRQRLVERQQLDQRVPRRRRPVLPSNAKVFTSNDDLAGLTTSPPFSSWRHHRHGTHGGRSTSQHTAPTGQLHPRRRRHRHRLAPGGTVVTVGPRQTRPFRPQPPTDQRPDQQHDQIAGNVILTSNVFLDVVDAGGQVNQC